MAAITHDPVSAGSAIDHLKSLLLEKQRPIDMLVISHDDCVVNGRLAEVIDAEDSVIFPVPQPRWDDTLTGVAAWAVSEANVGQMLVVGHSMSAAGGVPNAHRFSKYPLDDQGTGSSDSCGRLVASVKRAQLESHQAKQHFMTQVSDLCEVEAVQDAIAGGRLKIHALFYLAESGVFLSYDATRQSFRPLLG